MTCISSVPGRHLGENYRYKRVLNYGVSQVSFEQSYNATVNILAISI